MFHKGCTLALYLSSLFCLLVFFFIFEYISIFYSEVIWDTCPLRGRTGVFLSPVDFLHLDFGVMKMIGRKEHL